VEERIHHVWTELSFGKCHEKIEYFGRGIAPGAISIDSTAIFIAVADSCDEE
jgi:hypothetical protein